MPSDEAASLREAFLHALREQRTEPLDLSPEDFDLEVMGQRMKPLPPEERQTLWDETGEEVCDLIVQMIDSCGAISKGTTFPATKAMLEMLDMLPFTEESFNKAYDRLHHMALAIRLKERAQEA